MIGSGQAPPRDGRVPEEPSVRAEVERVIAVGHFAHRALMIVLIGGQVVTRRQHRRLSTAERAAVVCAGGQVCFELIVHRSGPSRSRWVPAVTLVTSGAITVLGRRASNRSSEVPWETEWGIWSPFGLRLANVRRGWSAASALPFVACLLRPTPSLNRARASRNLVMLACAEVFANAFGSTLRRHGDDVDRLAVELTERRADTEVERAREALRTDSLVASTGRLRQIKRSIEQRQPDVAVRVADEYERLRRLILEAGERVGGGDRGTVDTETETGSETEFELERLAEETRSTLTRIGRLIPIPVGLIVTTAVAISPPHERRWLAVPIVGAHALRLVVYAGRSQSSLTDTGSRSMAATLDLAVGAVAYHVVDLFTAGSSGYPKWAQVSVTSLSLSAAATARTPSAALFPALAYAAARLATRRWWARDRTSAVEMLGTTAYLGVPAWALFRIIDGSWASVRRLSDWAVDAAELAASERLTADRRRVQVALHDHGVQTVRYVARNPDQPPNRRLELIDRAIAELELIAADSDQRRTTAIPGVRECVDGYVRFGLEPQLEVPGEEGTSPPADLRPELEGVIHDAVNQGLANVLAHTSDRRPVVRIKRTDHHLVVSVSNRSITTTGEPTGDTPRGFGLGHLDECVRQGGGSMVLGTEGGVTELRVTVPLAPPPTKPTA